MQLKFFCNNICLCFLLSCYLTLTISFCEAKAKPHIPNILDRVTYGNGLPQPVIFPILMIKGSDFIQFYKRHNCFSGARTFRKLLFQFRLIQSGDDQKPDTMKLICYALNKPRDTMALAVVPVSMYTPFTAGPISKPMNLGNLELTSSELKKIIGPRKHIIQFTFLRLEPVLRDGYIKYRVFLDNNVNVNADEEAAANPCPPAHSD